MTSIVRKVNSASPRSLTIYLLVVAVSVLSGCHVQMTPDRYAVSGSVGSSLQQQVNVADFFPYPGQTAIEPSGTDRRSSASDLVLVCSPSSGLIAEQTSYSDVAGYFRNALISELELVNAYATDSPVTISGTLLSISFSFHRVAGLASTGGTWDIVVKLESSNGAEFLFDDSYSFETGYGPSQCDDMVEHFMPSIQYFIEKLVDHPDFKTLAVSAQ